MAFAKTTRAHPVPDDPEALYRQLARTNNGPDSLWSHQTDILRDWHGHYIKTTDVALELPTGAGKTLVGGLIGEWLRQSERKPVAYLCPNNQLAAQAANRLGEYGIPVSLLTGRVNRWDPVQRAKFTAADTVAVSIYSHVFNTNPGIIGAGTLLFDDAHAGEQPVAAAWSINIKREEGAYQQVLSVLSEGLSDQLVSSLRDDDSVRKYSKDVFLVAPAIVSLKAPDLEQTLNAAVAAKQIDKDQSYPLSTLAGHLGQCLVYVSHRCVLIRPLISPTVSHPAFADAGRRVYMSATLGAGGELERAFGRHKIRRMPVPKGWDKQGTGRRFFVFPELATEMSGDETLVEPWLKSTIEKHGRATLLTPSDYRAEAVIAAALPDGYVKLDGHTVEKDMAEFTKQDRAVLSLTNRYDGVDLPDDACRLLILAGLPSQGDLQERFLYEALGAGRVLQERIRARLIQGSGRATRNAKDHATVVIIGDDLTNFIIRPDVLAALRQELQAEIEFGRKQSLDRPVADINENIDLFRAQSAEWFDVEAEITADRDTRERQDPPATKEIADAAPKEVAAIEAWWNGDIELALQHAQEVVNILEKKRDAHRYSALWHYLCASWTRARADETGDPTGSLGKAAAGHIRRARGASRGTTWLNHLVEPVAAITSAEDFDELDRLAAQNLVDRINQWSGADDKAMTDARAGLAQSSYKKYEAGLKTLGWYAGASEVYDDGGAQAAPDSTWIFGTQLWVAWEAKSEAVSDSSIPAKYTRQATLHLSFIADKRNGEEVPAGSFTCYTTPQTKIEPSARAVCGEDVYLIPIHGPADLLAALDGALTKARTFGGAVDEAGVLNALKAEGCLPSQWLSRFTSQPLKSFNQQVDTVD